MKWAVLIAMLLAAFIVVSEMDYADAQEYDAHKCEMVESGDWPESVLQGVECE